MALTWTPEDGTLAAADDAARSARYASPRPWIISGFALSAGTGLNVAVSAGTAWIAGYYVEWDASAEQAVAASNTNYVYVELTRDVNDNVTGVAFVINTTGTPPSGDHIVLGTATADGSGVTGTATTGRSPQNQGVTSVFGRDGAVVAAASDYDADQVDYDNSVSGLAATDVQAAVDELAARPTGGGWDGLSFRLSDLSKNNTTFESLISSALEANKTYYVECEYYLINGGGGNKVQISLPAGSTADVTIDALLDNGSYSANVIQFFFNVAAGVSTNLNGATGLNQKVIIRGFITTDATAGNVNIEVAQQAASGTTTFKAGASLKWKDIT